MITIFSFVCSSIPAFVLAVLLKNAGIGFNNVLGFTGERSCSIPPARSRPACDAWSWRTACRTALAHLVLPTLVLIVGAIAFYSRYQRNAMLDVLGSDFLRTAQAKGLRRPRALVKHALRTALIPMATFFAYEFALLFVGATFTEKIFGWHGMGEWFVDSVTKNDVNAVAGVTLFVAVLVLHRRVAVGRRLRGARPAGPGVADARADSDQLATLRRRARSPTREAVASTRRARVALRLVSRRFLRRRLAVVGLAVLVLLFVLAYVGPVLRPVAVQPARHQRVPVAAVGRALVRHDAERLRHVRADDARHAEVAGHRPARRADRRPALAAVVGAFAGYFGGC